MIHVFTILTLTVTLYVCSSFSLSGKIPELTNLVLEAVSNVNSFEVYDDIALDSDDINNLCTQHNIECPSSKLGFFLGIRDSSPFQDLHRLCSDIEDEFGVMILPEASFGGNIVSEYYDSYLTEELDNYGSHEYMTNGYSLDLDQFEAYRNKALSLIVIPKETSGGKRESQKDRNRRQIEAAREVLVENEQQLLIDQDRAILQKKLEQLGNKGSRSRTDEEKVAMIRAVEIYRHHPYELGKTAAINEVQFIFGVQRKFLFDLYNHWVMTGQLLQRAKGEKPTIETILQLDSTHTAALEVSIG